MQTSKPLRFEYELDDSYNYRSCLIHLSCEEEKTLAVRLGIILNTDEMLRHMIIRTSTWSNGKVTNKSKVVFKIVKRTDYLMPVQSAY